MRRCKIGIVGCGPGGLMTAYFLEKYSNLPLAITIFEAAERIGGKVHTRKFKSADVTYEAGAAELYDYSDNGTDSLRELVDELGLPTQSMEGCGVVLDGKWIGNLDDFRREFGEQELAKYLEFHRRAQDQITPNEFYDADHPEGLPSLLKTTPFVPFLDRFASPVTRRFVETLIHSDLATEPSQTSTTYGLQNYLMNDPKYMRLYCIDGGNERIIAELANRVHADVRLNTSVASIFRTQQGLLAVESLGQDQRDLDEFDFVIVALPYSHLRTVQFAGDKLTTAVEKHIDYYNHPAHYLRMTLLFEKPFWRQWMKDSFCMLDQLGGCCLYDESLRQPGTKLGVLGWLIGGEAAKQMSEKSDAELIAAAMDSLPSELSAGREMLREGIVQRWVKAVSSLPGGVATPPMHQRHCPEPSEHSNLYFVGDYLFDSTLNGVLDSAEYVAGWLTANLMLPQSPLVVQSTAASPSVPVEMSVRANKGNFECQPVT
jgi:monoamine oxidase